MIETHRLILRRWKTEDLPAFVELNADPRVMEFFAATLTREETATMMQTIDARIEERGFGLWAAELKSTREVTGFIGLNIPGYPLPFSPCVEVGWRLAFKHWGKGYAQEGARGALEFGFDQIGLKEIVSFTAVGNLRSRHVMERIGMQRDLDGDFAHPKLDPGHPLSKHVLYRISSI